MAEEIHYIEINRKMWDFTASIYENEGLENTVLRIQQKDFKTFDDIEENIFSTYLDIKNKDIIQIGCNNGIELIYLKTLGANRCLGVDISSKFIEHAKKLSIASKTNVQFECTNILNIPESFYNQFDLVYITVGVLGWMPNVNSFFEIINKLLVKGGLVFLYEQHPILGMFNPEPPHLMDASYFRKEPFKDDIVPEYIDKNGKHKATSYWFPYTISAILSACIKCGLEIKQFGEYPSDISETYDKLETEKKGLPLSFTLIAKK